MNRKLLIISALCLLAALPASGAKRKSTKDVALETMKAATTFMMDEVSCNGGFVWTYLPDFTRRWGEMEAKPTMAWTQGAGTPAVGNILLDAYHATGDEYYYQQAEKVAMALIWGQLECGGWNYVFDFAGEASLKDWYRTVGHSGWRLEEFQHYYGNATFDDSATTSCAKFLLRIYMEKRDAAFRPAVDKAMAFVLESQYPIGGWPQRYPLMQDHPTWIYSRTPDGKEFKIGGNDYTSFITLNDDVIPEATDFLLQCYQCLGIPGLKEPIMRAMYLAILLQQGKPYAGWADQYSVADLKPEHARSYEPRGISASGTTRMVRLLMRYYTLTGDSRFLAGIPAALDFLESIKLSDEEVRKWGRQPSTTDDFYTPRFVDPEDGTPYYIHREGSNIFNGHYYVDQDIRNTIGHYGSVARVNTKELRRQYEELLSKDLAELTKGSPLLSTEFVPLDEYYVPWRSWGEFGEKQVLDICNALSDKGCWLSPLRSTSNPYLECPDPTPSKATEFCSQNVGDQYDTSPHSAKEPVMGISTQDYISKMAALISFVK